MDYTDSHGTLLATITWTKRVNASRVEQFHTFCVIFDTGSGAYCSLREALWSLNVDTAASSDQKATVTSDSAAADDPATGIQANHAPLSTTKMNVGSATVTFTN
jgi:hypothetical protein